MKKRKSKNYMARSIRAVCLLQVQAQYLLDDENYSIFWGQKQGVACQTKEGTAPIHGEILSLSA